MRLLIADDEKLIVDDLTRDVHEIYPEAEIDGTTDAAAALEYANTSKYDIALLDIEMPGVDGLTLARTLIANSPVVNIIFVTGYQQYALDAHELYCSGFLMKPVGVRKLKQAFTNLRKPVIDIPIDIYTDRYAGSTAIGKKLKLCREQRNITRTEMARLMDVSRQTIFRWEHGDRVPDVLTFIKLTRLLGVEIGEVLGGTEPPL